MALISNFTEVGHEQWWLVGYLGTSRSRRRNGKVSLPTLPTFPICKPVVPYARWNNNSEWRFPVGRRCQTTQREHLSTADFSRPRLRGEEIRTSVPAGPTSLNSLLLMAKLPTYIYIYIFSLCLFSYYCLWFLVKISAHCTYHKYKKPRFVRPLVLTPVLATRWRDGAVVSL